MNLYLSPYLTPMNHRYNAEVDKFINDLLDREPELTVDDGGYYAIFKVQDKHISVWIENRWYAYATRGCDTTESKGKVSVLGNQIWNAKRPRRRTMIRLYKYINKRKVTHYNPISLDSIIGKDTNNG